jgi:hypothetical protein
MLKKSKSTASNLGMSARSSDKRVSEYVGFAKSPTRDEKSVQNIYKLA